MNDAVTFGVVVLLTAAVGVANAVEFPSYVSPEQSRVVAAWLAKHSHARLAVDSDCRCDEELKRVRTTADGAWKAQPTYHPYYVSGDFNGDGIADLAVGVVGAQSPGEFSVVVFNGPLGKQLPAKADFVSEPRPLGEAMFFGPPRPMPYLLVVGAFASEGSVLRPTANGYVLEEGDE